MFNKLMKSKRNVAEERCKSKEFDKLSGSKNRTTSSAESTLLHNSQNSQKVMAPRTTDSLPKRSLFSFSKKNGNQDKSAQVKRVSSVSYVDNRDHKKVHPRIANTVKKSPSLYAAGYYKASTNVINNNINHNSNPNIPLDMRKSSIRKAFSKLNIFRHGNVISGHSNSNHTNNDEYNHHHHHPHNDSFPHEDTLRFMSVYSDIGYLMGEFSKNINNEHDIRVLCMKILKNAAIKLKIDRCSLFLVENDLQRENSKVLVEFIFDITNKTSNGSNLTSIDELISPLKPNLSEKIKKKIQSNSFIHSTENHLISQNHQYRYFKQNKTSPTSNSNSNSIKRDMHTTTQKIHCIVIPWGMGIAGKSAQTGNVINIEDAYNESYFYKNVDCATGYRTKSVLCIPLKNSNGDVIGVVEAINKLPDADKNMKNSSAFTLEDEEAFTVYAELCCIALEIRQKIIALTMHQNKSKMEQLFFDIYQEEDIALEILFSRVICCLMELINCQQISIILTNDDDQLNFKHIFSLGKNNPKDSNQKSLNNPINTVPIEYAIESALCNKIINYINGISSDMGDNNLAAAAISTICSCPINDNQNEIWGILQCVNRQNSHYFNNGDIELLKTTTTYLSFITDTISTREENLKIQARNKILVEILSYHVQPNSRLVLKLLSRILPSGGALGIYRFDFDDTIFDDDTTVLIAMRLFIDLDLTKTFRIENKVLCRWLTTLKNNYRHVKYHNWRHALNVTHTMFFLLKITSLGKYFNDIQKLALLIACISHDVDHRGYNNGFYSKLNSPLSHIYTSSTLESHHFDQCMLVLNMKGCNILKYLHMSDFPVMIENIEQSILDTDLSNYIKHRGKFFKTVKEGLWSVNNAQTPNNIRLLQSMMITLSDLNCAIKPWNIHYRTSALISEEFFLQGDVELRILKQCPLTLLDRTKSNNLPNMQIDFIDAMCLPLVENLAKIAPEINFMETNISDNRSQWRLLIGKFDYDKFKKEHNLDVLYTL